VPEIWERLRGVDLHTLQTGIDNIRNINGCPLAGLTADELLDGSPVVFELDRMLVGADGNPEFTNLPRKFNITITGCRSNCTHTESQDIALIPAAKEGRRGFNVLVGGKMGSGGFTIASPLGVFVEVWEAAEVTAELVRMFRDHGPRDARAKIRFAFLVEKWGIERLLAELQSRVGRELESPGEDCRRHQHADHMGVTPQKGDGLLAVGMGIPTGRLRPEQMEEMAALAEEYGSGDIRLTTAQNAVIPNVPTERLANLLREPLLQVFSADPSPFLRGMVACTGSDYCNLAQIQTKKLAVELSAALEERFGTAAAPLTMNWSGCVAGCGNHQASDIGFRGMKVNVGDRIIEAVAIYAGGRTGPHAVAGEQILDVVPCDSSLADVVADVILQRGLLHKPPVTPDFVPVEALTGELLPTVPLSPMPEIADAPWAYPNNNIDAPPSLGGD